MRIFMKKKTFFPLLLSFFVFSVFAKSSQNWQVQSPHVINLYEQNQHNSKVVGIISSKAQNLKNLGCSKDGKWCKVEYRDMIGWIEKRYLVPFQELTSANLAGSKNILSVNCEKVQYRVDKVICNTPHLKKLEEQISFKYEKVLSMIQEKGLSEDEAKVIYSHSEWANKRNDCWRSEKGIAACVELLAQSRLNELNTYEVPEHISQKHYMCEDGTEFYITNNAQDESITVDYDDQHTVLIESPTDFGTKYGINDEKYIWLSGKDAIFNWEPEINLQHCEESEESENF